MKEILKIYTEIGSGSNDKLFKDNISISEYTYNSTTFNVVKQLSATLYYNACLDDFWTGNEYVTYKGARYYIRNVPTWSLENTDTRYKYDVQFVSDAKILENVYWYDTYTAGYATYYSESTKIMFMGDIKQFVARMNAALSKSIVDGGWSVIVADNVVMEDKLVSMDKVYFSDALKYMYDTFNVPYYIVGKVIYVGLPTTILPFTFEFGQDKGLYGLTKTQANFRPINRITGIGSTENIPYYYPNLSPKREEVQNWIEPQANLMPPLFRKSNGKEKFYNAINNTYLLPNSTTEYYQFDNIFNPKAPSEHVQEFNDIKPTIKGMTYNSMPIDVIKSVQYDADDNDNINTETGDVEHPYFKVNLNPLGFDLFKSASARGEMAIYMNTGSCGACEFRVMVDESKKINGSYVDGSYIDSTNNSVTLILEKDLNTYGTILPSQQLKVKAADKFVILYIDLPQSYIDFAENKLYDAIIKHIYENNKDRFNFTAKFDEKLLTLKPEIENQIAENTLIPIKYKSGSKNADGTPKYITVNLNVQSITIKQDDASYLPSYEINLTDNVTISSNSVDKVNDKIDIIDKDVTTVFKNNDEQARRNIKALKDAEKYIFDPDGKIKVDRLSAKTIQGLIGIYGTDSGAYYLNGVKLQTNVGGNQNAIHFSAGALHHYIIKWGDKETNNNFVWNIAQPLSRTDLVSAQNYYIYIQANRNNNSAIWYVSIEQLPYDSNQTVYYFLVGTLLPVDNGYRSQTFQKGLTYINGGDIKAGTISSFSGDLIIDLDRNFINAKNGAEIKGKITFSSGSSGLKELNEWGSVENSITNAQDTANKGVSDAAEALRKAIKAETDAANSVAEFNAKFATQQAQIDGEVSNWYYNYKPTLTNAPANSWTTNIEKDRHIGDTFLNTEPFVDNIITPDAGKAWRYVKNGSAYSWTPIADSDAVKALQEAAKAKSTADGKSTTYIVKPAKYVYGDMWVLENDTIHTPNKQGEILFASTTAPSYNPAHWVSKVRYTDDTVADTAKNEADKANANLADLASDNKLSPSEKTQTLIEWERIKMEHAKNIAIATNLNIATNDIVIAFNTLSSYITPLLTNLTVTSDINGIQFRSVFATWYEKNVILLNVISVANSEKAANDIERENRNLFKICKLNPIHYKEGSSYEGEGAEIIFKCNNNGWGILPISNPEPLVPSNTDFVVSFDFRNTNGFGFELTATSGTPTVIMGYTPIQNTTNVWKRISFTKNTGNVENFGGINLNGRGEVRHIKIEKGKKETSWNAAPEDKDAEMSKLFYKNIASQWASGKILHTDPTFTNGINDVTPYIYGGISPTDRNDNKRVATSDIPTLPKSPINSNYVYKCETIYTEQDTSRFGFHFMDRVRAGMILVTRIIALIPKGYTINMEQNSIGNTPIYYGWTTPNRGTGKWEEYIHLAYLSQDGNFSNMGFYYLAFDKGNNTKLPFSLATWYVAYATTSDLTNSSCAAIDAIKAINAAATANAAIGNLNTYVDGAFSDGIIEASEAKAISTYINNINEAKAIAENSYNEVYENTLLTGTAKTNLSTAKVYLDTERTALLNSINTAIADGKTTAAEKADVDTKFAYYNSAYGIFSSCLEKAIDSIQDVINQTATSAKEKAEQSLKRQMAMADDNIITKEEKATLRNEYKQIEKTYRDIELNAQRKGVDFQALINAYVGVQELFGSGFVYIEDRSSDFNFTATLTRDMYNSRLSDWTVECSRISEIISKKEIDLSYVLSSTNIPTRGLLAYYPLRENAKDYFGTNNGTEEYMSYKKYRLDTQLAYFNGDRSRVVTPLKLNNFADEITVTVTIIPDRWYNYSGVFGTFDDVIICEHNTDNLVFYLKNVRLPVPISYFNAGEITTIAMVGKVGDYLKIYAKGLLIAKSEIICEAFNASVKNIIIGNRWDGSNRFFAGYIFNFTLHAVALTEKEIYDMSNPNFAYIADTFKEAADTDTIVQGGLIQTSAIGLKDKNGVVRTLIDGLTNTDIAIAAGIGDDGIIENANYRVYDNGNLFASKANIEGNISALKGSFGSMNIQDDGIFDSNKNILLSNKPLAGYGDIIGTGLGYNLCVSNNIVDDSGRSISGEFYKISNSVSAGHWTFPQFSMSTRLLKGFYEITITYNSINSSLKDNTIISLGFDPVKNFDLNYCKFKYNCTLFNRNFVNGKYVDKMFFYVPSDFTETMYGKLNITNNLATSIDLSISAVISCGDSVSLNIIAKDGVCFMTREPLSLKLGNKVITHRYSIYYQKGLDITNKIGYLNQKSDVGIDAGFVFRIENDIPQFYIAVASNKIFPSRWGKIHEDGNGFLKII